MAKTNKSITNFFYKKGKKGPKQKENNFSDIKAYQIIMHRKGLKRTGKYTDKSSWQSIKSSFIQFWKSNRINAPAYQQKRDNL